MDRLEPGRLVRHRHQHAYAALVVSGGYEEAGDMGRFRVAEGDMLVHRCFEAHLNLIHRAGAAVVNIPLPGVALLPPAFKVVDPDGLLRASASERVVPLSLLGSAEPIQPLDGDWPDRLARAINASPSLRLDRWAAENGLNPATVSRGFRQVYGIPPARFRAEARARQAWWALTQSATALAAVAHDLGFADQAHMSRAVRSLTQRTPAQWRQVKSVQDPSDHRAYAAVHEHDIEPHAGATDRNGGPGDLVHQPVVRGPRVG